MDITDALAPTSDQLDAVELVNPRTFTIDTGSRLGKREGKTVAEIRLVNFDRVWRPSKGMLDVLAGCWGTDAKAWVGRSVTLYCDPEVMFGPNKVGGVRISHLSHIDKARTLSIRASGQGKRKDWHVEPLAAPVPEPTAAQVAASTDHAELRAWWQVSGDERRAQIQARASELKTPANVTDADELTDAEFAALHPEAS
ncbi:hypothetical protein [Occultella gossypii]|uniref:Uncharacterized protein n=1 Tax=Occultella gossypii TaxID=2800820 RepID=A0ABS7SBK0_9MICO|nr:hypothetical protein [Occultella gossypii]MBZ2197248.1 hypothetical protein [Occultella gossypii]